MVGDTPTSPGLVTVPLAETVAVTSPTDTVAADVAVLLAALG
ncbi:unannotated protein [freshwater metagenome]|uniref:Unannotated protein n=1 Tax=freshwater metagenome TaxID=449393 RepID=A0A6J7DNL0_9ZZZZ